MEKSQIMSDFVKMSKGDKRLANKKRKAEVLLNLLSQKQERNKSKIPENETSIMEKSDESPAKKSKVEISQSSFDSKTAGVTDEKTLRMLEKKRQKRLRLKEIRTQIKKIQKQNSSTKERPVFHLALQDLLNEQLRNQQGPPRQAEELPTLYMLDVQHLLTLGLLPDSYMHYPRWCKLARPGKVASVVVIVLDQLSASDLEEYQECFPFMKKTFNLFVEVVSPYQYGSSVMKDMFRVPVSITGLKNKAWSKEADRDTVKQQISEIRQVVGKPSTDVVQTPEDFNRKHLLLNPLQLMHESYPMPIKTLQDRYRNFRFSCDSYKAVTKKSPMFAVDCEMCLTTAQENELTRISVVNEKLETVYDTLVKPRNKIINYLTQYSGITKKMLEPVKTRLSEVQKKLRELLPSDAIWLGQSLNNDLIALKLFHPYVIDTSVIFNLSGFKWKKTGLKVLTAKFLKQDIQMGSEGHSPVEDARATMELVQLKLSKGVTFGDATISVVDSEEEADVKGQSGSDEVKGQSGSDEDVKNQSETVNPDIGQSETVDKVQGQSAGDEKVRGQYETAVPTEEEKSSTISKVFDKRRLFFQQKGKYLSFFTLAKNGKKSAVVIDRKEEMSEVTLDSGVKCIAETSDRTRTQAAVTAVQKEDFVWVHLHALGNSCLSELREEKGTANSGEEKPTAASGEKSESVVSGEEKVKALSEEGKEITRTAEEKKDDNSEDEYEEGEIRGDPKKMKCLKRLDKRVKKIVQKVRSRSLVCVVLSGQANEDSVLNGGALIKIT